MKQAVSTQGLLPHAYPMHLIDEVLEFSVSPVAGVVSARIREDAPYQGQFGFEDHWLIEMCAQASAAIYILAHRDDHESVPRGYLVSVREFQLLHTEPLRTGDDLIIEILYEVEATPLGQTLCVVKRGPEHEKIAVAEMSFLMETEG